MESDTLSPRRMDVKACAQAQVAQGDHLHQLGPAHLKSLGAREEKQGQAWLPISPTHHWWYVREQTPLIRWGAQRLSPQP